MLLTMAAFGMTIKARMRNIFVKREVDGRTRAAMVAVRRGMVDL